MGLFDWFRRNKALALDSHAAVPLPADLIAFWRRWIAGEWKAWVLFRQGTCVVLTDPVPDPRTRAVELLKDWGPVEVGSPAGDFSVVSAPKYPGWVVTCHHPDILTYVRPDELPSGKRGSLSVGVYGRRKRDTDAAELEVIHIELRQ